MKLLNAILFTGILLTMGCCRYPSLNQLKKEKIKEDRKIVGTLAPSSLPGDFFNNHVEDIYLKTGWYFITDSIHGVPREIYRGTVKKIYYVDTTLQLAPKDIELFCLSPDYHNKAAIDLIMYFDEEGTKKWEIVTEKSINENLAFIVNNLLLIAPKVNSAIIGGVSVLWGDNYTAEEMLALKLLLQKQKDTSE
jgi:hypothetical protein